MHLNSKSPSNFKSDQLDCPFKNADVLVGRGSSVKERRPGRHEGSSFKDALRLNTRLVARDETNEHISANEHRENQCTPKTASQYREPKGTQGRDEAKARTTDQRDRKPDDHNARETTPTLCQLHDVREILIHGIQLFLPIFNLLFWGVVFSGLANVLHEDAAFLPKRL